MLFDSWSDLLRVLLMGTCAYIGLIAALRVSGKRTLAKMNAFDFVVTVALGSTLATILLTKDVSLAEGLLAFVVLVMLQFVIAWLSVRSKLVERFVKSDARVLLLDGKIDERALEQERVTREEVSSAIRSSGIGDLASVAAVVLETDGTFSVISRDKAGNRSALPEDAR